jgi:SAM-dependent methyltransferase
MNSREVRFFSEAERQLPDATALTVQYLIKALLVKLRRRLYGSWLDAGERMVWTVTTVSEATPPALNVRNYYDRRTVRTILHDITGGRPLARACEIGCGYGRVTMVLAEFAGKVTAFEREEHLVDIARPLLPDVEFVRVEALASISDPDPFDLVMTCTVLQHLTDREASDVAATMRRLAPRGHVVCVEKTEAIEVTENIGDGRHFISRARSVEHYRELMHPFRLVMTRERIVEPTFANPRPGTCMVFESPDAGRM